METNGLLSDNQGGFRKNYRTVDKVFMMKTILKKYIYKEKRKVYACFVDFKKAFDSVWRSALFIKLQSVGIRGKLYNIIHDLYSNTLCACKDFTHHSNPFLANHGVKQGGSLRPTLFIFLWMIFEITFNSNITDPIHIQDKTLNHLFPADDLLLVSESPTGLQRCLDLLQNYCSDW